MGKDSPLVKELYALFCNNDIPPGIKLAEYRKAALTSLAILKQPASTMPSIRQQMAENDNPPLDISKYSGLCNNVSIFC